MPMTMEAGMLAMLGQTGSEDGSEVEHIWDLLGSCDGGWFGELATHR